MNVKICYYESEAAEKIHDSVTQNLIFKESKNFPRIRRWNIYTAEIPSTKDTADSFRKFYQSKVVDQNVLDDLEEEKIINALPNMAKLYPILTPADGNCLCHAVSLYIWGVPDRRHFLRQLLYVTMVTDENKLLQRLYMQHVANQQITEETFNSGIWSRQWDRLVMEAQETPMNSGSTQLEPLEAIHIFILANILLRPIIVLSPPMVRTVYNHTIQSDNIGGIYLPFLCNPNDTEKSPIVLGYNMNHFTPLVHMQNSPGMKAIPLKRIDLVNLTVHFSQDLIPDSIAKKLKTYLEIDKKTELALIEQIPLPKGQDIFHAHFGHCKVLYDTTIKPGAGNASSRDIDLIGEHENGFLDKHSDTIHIISSSQKEGPSLCINNCGMYGTPEMGNRCSKCFAKDTQSDLTPQWGAKSKSGVRTPNVYGSEQLSNKQILEFNFQQFAPVRECKPSSYHQRFQDISVPNHRPEPRQTGVISISDFLPAESVESEKSRDEYTRFIAAQQKMGQEFEDITLEMATCVTLGCREKAHRNQQYRCATCLNRLNSQNTSTVLARPNRKETDLRTVYESSQYSQNYPYKQELRQPGIFSRSEILPVKLMTPQISQEESTQFIPIKKKVGQQSEQRTLETATCITPGCRVKAHEKLQYRCASCFIKRNSQNPADTFMGSNPQKNDSRIVDQSSLNKEKTSEKFTEKFTETLSEQGAIANPGNLGSVSGSSVASPVNLIGSEERQVSLLELLCSEYNCPNRKVSPSDPLCPSCSKKKLRVFCSTPGCEKERELNSHAMCKECYQKNELDRLKNPTQRYSPNHIPDSGSSNTNQEPRKCNKPNCINAKGPYSTGYCLQCYSMMEKTGPRLASAPSFAKLNNI